MVLSSSVTDDRHLFFQSKLGTSLQLIIHKELNLSQHLLIHDKKIIQ